MPDHHLKVFRDLHVVDWYVDWVISKFFAFASVKANNRVGYHSNVMCF